MQKRFVRLSLWVFISAALTFYADAAQSQETAAPQAQPFSCEPSAAFIPEKPKLPSDAIHNSNNLRRLVGSAQVAKGRKIMISGRVFDERCIPVKGASVQLWQPDTNGVWYDAAMEADASNDEQPAELSDDVAQQSSLKQPDPHFAGHGKIFTNNLGEFHFLTVFPGQSTSMQPPFIHLYISHPDLTAMQTRLYFPEAQYSPPGHFSRQLVSERKEGIFGETIYMKDYVLPGSKMKRHY